MPTTYSTNSEGQPGRDNRSKITTHWRPRGLLVIDTLTTALDIADTLIHQRTPSLVASGRPDDARWHGLDSDEAAASGFEDKHEPVVVLVAFVPRRWGVARCRRS